MQIQEHWKAACLLSVTSAKANSLLLWCVALHLLSLYFFLRPNFLERCGLLKSMRQSLASEMGVKDLMGELLIVIEDTPPSSSPSSSPGTTSSFRRSMTSLRWEQKNWSFSDIIFARDGQKMAHLSLFLLFFWNWWFLRPSTCLQEDKNTVMSDNLNGIAKTV